MDRSDINSLLDKFLAGTSTAEEIALFETWYMKYEDKSLDSIADQARIAQLEKIRSVVVAHSTQVRRIRLWPRFRIKSGMTGLIAAAAVAAIVFGVWFFNSESGVLKQVQDDVVYKNDIAPGTNGATITLGNGEVIALSGAKKGVIVGDELKYSDGSTDPALSRSDLSITGGEGSVMLTASTAKGQMYEFTLPDGTHVWLNADSKVSFPSQFNGKERKILLNGEAYFEVAKDKAHPFRVESKGQEVEVLGTHFNVNAYPDEAVTKTTLLEGSVKVNGSMLKPEEEAVLSNSVITIKSIDATKAVAWKNGKFDFVSEDIKSIMRKIARWYNVEVIYQDELENSQFTGSFSRFGNVSTVLRTIELTNTIHFKVEGRRIIVTK